MVSKASLRICPGHRVREMDGWKVLWSDQVMDEGRHLEVF